MEEMIGSKMETVTIRDFPENSSVAVPNIRTPILTILYLACNQLPNSVPSFPISNLSKYKS
jgi:hypothetical protein